MAYTATNLSYDIQIVCKTVSYTFTFTSPTFDYNLRCRISDLTRSSLLKNSAIIMVSIVNRFKSSVLFKVIKLRLWLSGM
jgi:hypothetical protein